MAPSPDDSPPTPAPAFSSHARDRGLRRSRRTTLWIAVTAAAGAAALGGVYTHVLPGGPAAPAPVNAPVHHPAASTGATVGKGGEEPNGHEDGEDDNDEEGAAPVTQPAPQPPAQPPAATQQQPQTTTGAS
ncbi:hypothetical protein OG806_01860 [Streptomyces sp. NBC_00882]|uniref:hypothetical protein n=1 Tax=Streptomyces TaxID=1883 RepID=UPI00386BC0F5|nr:hypothetical protein OG806_01860 [Streptomyces sp. NBC_00882]WSZ55302.1 hypothetical protein OH824_01435 [Streptomyces canus]